MNKELAIATAPSRFSKSWKNRTTTWDELVEQLETPARTGETMAEYRAMKKSERDNRKDVGGFVCGRLKDGRRKKDCVLYRSAVTLDADSASRDFLDRLGVLPCAWAVYSTHSHTEESPRYRLVVPLGRNVTPEEYQAISRKLADMVDIEAMDPTTYDIERLMYLPSCPSDAPYIMRHQDTEFLDPDTILATYEDWRDVSTWPASARESKVIKKLATGRQADPLTKGGVIGAFCKAYSISKAIEAFLANVYTPTGKEDRYTYAPGSTVGGAVVYDDKFMYSHHATDPAGNRLCNAFDLVRIHYYGDQDEEVVPGTPVAKLPSFTAMKKFARNDPDVKEILRNESLASLGAAFGEEKVEGIDWKAKLEWSDGEHPKILPNAFNFKLILENDENLKDAVGTNTFASRMQIKHKVPWRTWEDYRDLNWRDTDDAGLRNYLSTTYKLVSRQVIDDALSEVAGRHAFHPVREYLAGLTWDGTPRARSIFIDWLGAEDSVYTREVTEKWLLAAVTRVMRPGYKFDYCLVLLGPQGIGKSTVLARLGGRWFCDSLVSFKGKDAMEMLLGHTIIELSEMQAATRAENDQVKAFISRTEDKYRAAYGRRYQSYPRQCVFAATTNETDFLKDRTGGRRFWALSCEAMGRPIVELDRDYIDQLWAEVYQWYQEKETLDLELSAESLKVARKLQEEHTEGAERKALVQSYLDTLLPEDWETLDIGSRRYYLRDPVQIAEKGKVQRRRVCILEIWCELLEGNKKDMKNLDARELNAIMQSLPDWKAGTTGRFGGEYGRQRAYYRMA